MADKLGTGHPCGFPLPLSEQIGVTRRGGGGLMPGTAGRGKPPAPMNDVAC